MPELSPHTLGSAVARTRAAGSEAWSLALDVPEVVSFAGSIATGLDFATSDRLLQRMVGKLLDRGCERLDRFEIALWLERRGAQLHFYSDYERIAFSGRALHEDAAAVIALAAELLATPRFDSDEIVKVQVEMEAGMREAAVDTAFLADAALSRVLYAPAHPGFMRPLDQKRADLQALTRDDLVAFHRDHMLQAPLLLALAGDVEGIDVAPLLEAFGERQADADGGETPPPAKRVPGYTPVEVPDKANLDVRIGHGIALRRGDSDFIPMMVGVYALGGNFSARLMQEVRDRLGLTYGIGASLKHTKVWHDGHVEIRATFSLPDLQAGIEASVRVLGEWASGGVRAEELENVRETMLGTYDVGLSTTRGLATTLLHRAEQGFSPTYVDTYRDELRAVTRQQVDEAIARYVLPGAVHVVSSGAHPPSVTGS